MLQTNPDFWTTWNSFEIETGSEDTFREVRHSLPSHYWTTDHPRRSSSASSVPFKAPSTPNPPTSPPKPHKSRPVDPQLKRRSTAEWTSIRWRRWTLRWGLKSRRSSRPRRGRRCRGPRRRRSLRMRMRLRWRRTMMRSEGVWNLLKCCGFVRCVRREERGRASSLQRSNPAIRLAWSWRKWSTACSTSEEVEQSTEAGRRSQRHRREEVLANVGWCLRFSYYALHPSPSPHSSATNDASSSKASSRPRSCPGPAPRLLRASA